MKKIIFFLICSLLSSGIQSQGIIGAWEQYHTSEENGNLKTVYIYSDEYFTSTTFNANSGEFIATKGGSWKMENDSVTHTIEFDSKNPVAVGTQLNYKGTLVIQRLKLLEEI